MTTPTITPPPFAAMFLQPESVGRPQLIDVYGPHGRWKTSIAAGIVEVPQFANARVLMIDIDQGSAVLANNPTVKAKIHDGTFNIVPIDKTAAEAFQQLCYFLGYEDERGTWVTGEAFKYDYDIIILDTLDVAQDVAASWLTHNTYNDAGTSLNTQKAWGLVKVWTLGVTWAMKNSKALGIQVIHSKEETEAGRFKIKPSLSGSAKDALAAIPDLVVYVDFEQDPDDRDKTMLVGTVGESAVTETKNRWGLPSRFPGFNLPALYAAIDAQAANTNQQIAAKQAA